MSQTLTCRCGSTRLRLTGTPIHVSECLCSSCRTAGARLAALPGADDVRTGFQATPTADYRKDRVEVVAGAEHLAEFRLTPASGTRRIVASCCNTALFQEMQGGHWLSLYLNLWPAAARPTPKFRTMARDWPDRDALPPGMPNLQTHSLLFYARLLGAWIAMGFAIPKIEITRSIDA